MHPMSVLVERLLKLPPARTRDLVHERDLRVPMADGAELLADRWAPRDMGEPLPTLLARSPYGRSGPIAAMMAWPLAERGFQVVLQSTRGTFGSGGAFDPLRQEREDGLTTLDWIVKQPWFGDSLVLAGGSYLGFVQWAVADTLPPQVKAMIPSVTESALTLDFLRTDSYSLETPFSWGVMVAGQEKHGMVGGLLGQISGPRRVARALETLPLKDADVDAIGRHDDYVQNILAHHADDPFWAALNHRDRVAEVTVPVSSVGGWYDIFLPGQLRDFRVLQEAGRPARLTVGPWTHINGARTGIIETLEFGLAHARGESPPDREPVRLYVMGQERWRDFPSWPPPGYEPQRFHLRPGGGLGTEPPPDSEPATYRYDPAAPTPAAGGVRLSRGAGRVENSRLEVRPDVLTFTTPPLTDDIEVIGDVEAQVWFRSSLPYADVFVRLCDVDERGRSYNVCDGLIGVTGADETTPVRVELWPTAHRFLRGHRIRVQVSSGAFPRYARNPGTGEPIATATTLRAARQEVFHDPEHPSAIVLPVLTP